MDSNSNLYDFFDPLVLSTLDTQKKKLTAKVSSPVAEEYKIYSNQVDNKEYQYNMLGITGLGMGDIIADGQVLPSDAPIQGFAKSLTQYIFTKQIRFSQQEFYYLFKAGDGAKIDKELERKITDTKKSIVDLKNYIAQTLIANGWSSSVNFTPIGGTYSQTFDTTGSDGVPYFSASHPREDGGAVWSNIVFSGTTNPSFSLTSYIDACALHADKKDGRGLPMIGSNLSKVMFLDRSPAYFLASSISKTLSQGKFPSTNPGTSGSFVDANSVDSFEVIGLARYGAIPATTWFAIDPTMINDSYGLQYVRSMEMTSSPFIVNPNNKDVTSDTTEYATFGGADFRGWMASKGTNLA